MDKLIPVGLGELSVSANAEEVLVAYGLGSCVAIGMIDQLIGVGGLLHAVLPESNRQPPQPKFVDSGIRLLLEQMQQRGANRRRMLVHLAGGASVLTLSGYTQTFNIGTRNIASAIECLLNEHLSITSKDVGGSVGRTVRLYIRNGRMTVQSMGQPEKAL
ncbi:MAG TPA: chemotaxis protein CheD [Anaerolineales bacterium]|nr:chemotaxis protein CheD [Anaerolineales bacterium]